MNPWHAMKILAGLLLTLAALASGSSVSPSPAAVPERVALPARAQDDTPPQPTCEELCAALADAEKALAEARSAVSDAAAAWVAARTAFNDAKDAHRDAVAELEDIQRYADWACTHGTEEECQAALDLVNEQTGVVNDRKAEMDRAQADLDAAKTKLDKAKKARDDAEQARDDAQAAADDAGCECD